MDGQGASSEGRKRLAWGGRRVARTRVRNLPPEAA